jgi:phosphoglucosamine mutase
VAEQLFGTDGFRGRDDLTGMPGHVNSETFEGLAFAYVSLVTERASIKPTFVVGGDTRSSAPDLMAAVTRGAAAAGAEVWDVDVAPTPMLVWLAQKHGINAIAITASHNPNSDNGFKPFEIGGIKPTRDVLGEVEARYWQEVASDRPLQQSVGRVFARPELADTYLDGLVAKLDGPDVLQDRLVVVDGANGAASALAPTLYRRLGAEVVAFACDPRGVINKDCGAAHLEGVQAFLREHSELTGNPRFLGVFANDGDADRVMGVDGSGRIVNGNYCLMS